MGDVEIAYPIVAVKPTPSESVDFRGGYYFSCNLIDAIKHSFLKKLLCCQESLTHMI